MTRPAQATVLAVLSSGILVAASTQCIGCRAEQAATVVKVGAIMPLSGEMAKYGATSRAALQSAVADVNARSDQVEISLSVMDDGLELAKGVAAATRLTGVDGAEFIIGAWPSHVTKGVLEVTDAAPALVISPASTDPALSSPEGLFFRTCTLDSEEGVQAAELAAGRMGAKRVAVVSIDNDFGDGLSQAFMKRATELEVEVVLHESYKAETSNFRTMLAKLEVAKPDLVYFVSYSESAALLRQAREVQATLRWLGSTMMNDQDLVTSTDGAAEGVVFVSSRFSPDFPDAGFQQFRSRVKDQTDGLEIDVFAVNTYDAMTALAAAIEAGSGDPRSAARALRATEAFEGLTGPYRFRPDGSVARPFDIMKVEDGRIVPLD